MGAQTLPARVQTDRKIVLAASTEAPPYRTPERVSEILGNLDVPSLQRVDAREDGE